MGFRTTLGLSANTRAHARFPVWRYLAKFCHGGTGMEAIHKGSRPHAMFHMPGGELESKNHRPLRRGQPVNIDAKTDGGGIVMIP
jgi:hypothetical protein